MATIEVDKELRDKLKDMAKERRVTMYQLSKEYLEEGIDKDEKMIWGDNNGKSDT
jgi:predicted transcriptional regulator